MKEKTASLVTGLTFVATLGGLLFGYDTAVISGAVGAIDANFIDPLNLSETARSSLSGWTISSALFGCIIGTVIAGWVAVEVVLVDQSRESLGVELVLIVQPQTGAEEWRAPESRHEHEAGRETHGTESVRRKKG